MSISILKNNFLPDINAENIYLQEQRGHSDSLIMCHIE